MKRVGLFAAILTLVGALAASIPSARAAGLVVQPQFEAANLFEGDFAPVKSNGVWGVIDRKGQFVVPAGYEEARGLKDGLIAVKRGGRWGYIEPTGKVAVDFQFDDAGDFAEGLAPVKNVGIWKYIDKTGAIRSRAAGDFTEAGLVSEGYAPVKRAGSWHFWNARDDKLGPARKVEALYGFSEGMALYVEAGKRGYIALGPKGIAARFAEGRKFSEGLAAVRDGTDWGFVDKTGTLAIAARFKAAREFADGLAPVQDQTGKWGYADKTGQVVIAPQYDAAFGFSEGFALVRRGDQRLFIDKTGGLLATPVFRDASRFSSGLAPVKIDELWGYLARGGAAPAPAASTIATPATAFQQPLPAASIGPLGRFVGKHPSDFWKVPEAQAEVLRLFGKQRLATLKSHDAATPIEAFKDRILGDLVIVEQCQPHNCPTNSAVLFRLDGTLLAACFASFDAKTKDNVLEYLSVVFGPDRRQEKRKALSIDLNDPGCSGSNAATNDLPPWVKEIRAVLKVGIDTGKFAPPTVEPLASAAAAPTPATATATATGPFAPARATPPAPAVAVPLGHTDGIEAVAYAPNGEFIATGGEDGTIKLWSTRTRAVFRTIDSRAINLDSAAAEFSLPVTALEISADSTAIAFSQYSEARKVSNIFVIRADDGAKILALPDRPGRYGNLTLAASAGANVVAIETADGKAASYDLAGKPRPDAAEAARLIAASHDGRRFGRGSQDGLNQQPNRNYPAWLTDAKSSIVATLASPDGKSLFVGHSEMHPKDQKISNHIEIYDLASRKPVRRFGNLEVTISDMALSPDGKTLAVVGSEEGGFDFRLYDIARGTEIWALKEITTAVHDLRFSTDGSLFAYLDMGVMNDLSVWDVRSGRRLHHLVRDDGDISYDQSVTLPSFDTNGRTVSVIEHDGLLDAAGKLQAAIRSFDLASGAKRPSTPLAALQSGDPGGEDVSGDWDKFKVQRTPTGKLYKSGWHNSLMWFNSFELYLRATAPTARTTKITASGEVRSARFVPQQRKVIAGLKNGQIEVFDLETARSLATRGGHFGDIWSLSLTPDGSRLLTGGQDGTTRVWDMATLTELTTHVSIGKEWLTITPEGFFDASPNGARLISIVQGMQLYAIDQFYQQLYRPDLVREKLVGDPQGKVRAAAAQLDLTRIIASGAAPSIRSLASRPQDGGDGEIVVVETEIEDQGGGIGKIEWKVNGVTKAVELRGATPVQDTAAPAGTRMIKLQKPLQLSPGENRIEVVVYNKADLIASRPSQITLQRVVASQPKPRLFVLSVGVNAYADTALRLNYARPDAEAIAAALAKAGQPLYTEVKVTALTDNGAVSTGLDAAFTRLAGEIKPSDVFVFFLAGHGKTVDGRYYFLPQDIRLAESADVVRSGIGQDRWQEWLSRIPAAKSLVLLDTCESGSMTQVPGQRSAGIEYATAIEKLSRSTGRTTISAATDDKPALEGYRGHGVFTFAILDAVGNADLNKNKAIEVTELAGYVLQKVQDVSFSAFNYRQVPRMAINGDDFSVAAVTAGITAAETAQAPKRPTHVVWEPVAVAAEPGAAAGGTRLPAKTFVRVLSTRGDWGLIAVDGKQLGFVPMASLLAMPAD